MTLVSVTAVGAFDAVGSILVVALMIAPAGHRLPADRPPDADARAERAHRGRRRASAATGWRTGWIASIAGSMATMAGVVFGAAFLLAPERGLVAIARRRARQRWEFAQTMLAIHLLNHEGQPEAAVESESSTWTSTCAGSRASRRGGAAARRRGLVVQRTARWPSPSAAARSPTT